jgi:protein-tyrosine phosphatase
MFNLFGKKSIARSGILNDYTDIHSHILPGVDDGVKSDEEALTILDCYQALGVKKVIFTPHIMEDYTQNNATFLRSRFKQFQQLYHGEIELSLSAEYMLDTQFDVFLRSGDLLPLSNNYLLIETSYMSPPIHFIERLKDILSRGYFVVLAHPERYIYMQTKEEYKKLKKMGILFQLNLLSIAGLYGIKVERKAKILLEGGYYDFTGMDIHCMDYLTNREINYPVSQKQIKQILKIKNTFI